MTTLLTGLLLLPLLSAGEEERFSDVRIEKPFDRYLLASPLLMESTGAKVVKLSKKRTLVLAVASTALKDNSAAERLRAEKVCKLKAFAALVQEQKGVHVFHAEKATDNTLVVTEDDQGAQRSVSSLLEVTETRVEGIAKDMPVVGRWKSKEGDVFYLAIGGIVNKKGNLVSSGERD